MRLPNLLEVELVIKINRELEAQLLSFGKDLTVLSPPSLQSAIRQIIEQALEVYSKT
ncbi:WCX domain-containing protein [Spirosoma fluviale]|uniref:WYL domain-containing protein n=1 Tax=Spirosoma fluviale TaxID=1597977 RepID=UPI0037445269